MKTFKFITASILFIFLVFSQNVKAQETVKDLKNQVKNTEQKISTNEEMLMSGVTALKRVRARLEDYKKGKRVEKSEVKRKEKIIYSIEGRLDKLNTQIKAQKIELTKQEKKLSKKLNKQSKKRKSSKKNADTEVAFEKQEKVLNKEQSELAIRKKRLQEARAKLEEERKARELAYQKQQEAIRLEAEKLNQLDNSIKAEEEKITEEKNTFISDYEDDISINEEILLSGKEGLDRMKAKLEEAKKDPDTSEGSIARKEAIILKIQKRLDNIEKEINVKKQELSKLRAK